MTCGAYPDFLVFRNLYTQFIDGRPTSVTLSKTRVTDEAIFLTPRRSRGQIFSLYQEVLEMFTEIHKQAIARQNAADIIELRTMFGLFEEELKERLQTALALNQIYYLESLKAKFANFRAKFLGTGE